MTCKIFGVFARIDNQWFMMSDFIRRMEKKGLQTDSQKQIYNVLIILLLLR